MNIDKKKTFINEDVRNDGDGNSDGSSNGDDDNDISFK